MLILKLLLLVPFIMASSLKHQVHRLKNTFVSFEFSPPNTEQGLTNLLNRVERMKTLDPLFVTVTNRNTSSRTLDLANKFQNEFNLTTVVHLTCVNNDQKSIDSFLSRAKESNIKNILALKGDGSKFSPEFVWAVDLVKYIKKQHGDYFTIFVAGYPDGYYDNDSGRQDIEFDLPYLKEKVDAGADFILTQTFYDGDNFIKYEKLVKEKVGNAILVPGLFPFATKTSFNRSIEFSQASIPAELQAGIDSAEDDEDYYNLGVKANVDIIGKLKSTVKGFHFFTSNLENQTREIIEKSGLKK